MARSDAINRVSRGLLSAVDVVEMARSDERSPLRRIQLRNLLAAQPEWTQRRANSTLARLTADSRAKNRATLTIQWLLSERAVDRRQERFVEMLSPRRGGPPWEGFPFTPNPRLAEASTR